MWNLVHTAVEKVSDTENEHITLMDYASSPCGIRFIKKTEVVFGTRLWRPCASRPQEISRRMAGRPEICYKMIQIRSFLLYRRLQDSLHTYEHDEEVDPAYLCLIEITES